MKYSKSRNVIWIIVSSKPKKQQQQQQQQKTLMPLDGRRVANICEHISKKYFIVFWFTFHWIFILLLSVKNCIASH